MTEIKANQAGKPDVEAKQATPSPAEAAEAECKTWRALCEFLLQAEEPMAFLHAWNEGRFDACKRGWPEAPASVYPTPPQPPVQSTQCAATADAPVAEPVALNAAIRFLEAFEAESTLLEQQSVGIEVSDDTYFAASCKTSQLAHAFRASIGIRPPAPEEAKDAAHYRWLAEREHWASVSVDFDRTGTYQRHRVTWHDESEGWLTAEGQSLSEAIAAARSQEGGEA